MLRNPVDVMYAQHSQLVFNQREDLTDFVDALAAEDDRRAGRRVPKDAIRPEALFYRHSVRFAEQLQRYFDVFGRDGVHVIVFDDLVADARAVYRSTLEFIGVDSSFEVDLSVYNPNRTARSGCFRGWFSHRRDRCEGRWAPYVECRSPTAFATPWSAPTAGRPSVRRWTPTCVAG
jgi:hypothetical protein